MSSLFFLANEKNNNNKAQGRFNFNLPFGHSRYTFFIGVISLTEGKMIPIPCKSDGKDT